MENNKYNVPKLEVISIAANDVITASPNQVTQEEGITDF